MPPNPRVECEVNTCTHYKEGNYCAAKQIHIWHEEEGKMSNVAEQTQCKSFHKGGELDSLGSIHNANIPGTISGDPNPGVKCIVNSCVYWEPGDYCNAEAIYVSGKNSDECEDTNCATFKKAKDYNHAISPTPRVGE